MIQASALTYFNIIINPQQRITTHTAYTKMWVAAASLSRRYIIIGVRGADFSVVAERGVSRGNFDLHYWQKSATFAERKRMWRNGSRVRLRIWCLRTWGFESLHAHRLKASRRPASVQLALIYFQKYVYLANFWPTIREITSFFCNFAENYNHRNKLWKR